MDDLQNFQQTQKIKKNINEHKNDKNNPHNVTPQQIGAAKANHTHTAGDVGAAEASHTHTLSDLPITYGTADLTAGSSQLSTGAIYLVYE